MPSAPPRRRCRCPLLVRMVIPVVPRAHFSPRQRRRSSQAAALGWRSRVNAPFLLPPTRMIPACRREVGEVPHLLTHHGVDPVEHPVVHLQVGHLVLLGPWRGRHGVQSRVGVGAVLGDDDRLALARPAAELLLPRPLRGRQVAGVDVPAVVPVEHQHVAELRDPAFPVRGEHDVDEPDRPGPVQLAGELEQRLEVRLGAPRCRTRARWRSTTAPRSGGSCRGPRARGSPGHVPHGSRR